MTNAQESKQAERIVFFGDSITQQGAGPNGYVTLVRDAIDNQSLLKKVEIVGAGVSGNKVPNLLARLDKDVLSKNPSVVVIYIGINDVWHSIRNQGTPKEEFSKGLQELIERINSAGARVILCTPSVIGEKTDGTNDLDDLLNEYAQISRDVAAQTNTAMLDLRLAFLGELEKRNPENRSKNVLTRDGVHLNEAGNQFVAERMLAVLGLEEKANPLLRHIVLFKFKEELEPEKVQQIVAAFAELEYKIDLIEDFEMGTNNSPENLAQGFTHCFTVTFKNASDRDAYLPHEAHQEFVKMLDGKIDSVLVFDYESK